MRNYNCILFVFLALSCRNHPAANKDDNKPKTGQAVLFAVNKPDQKWLMPPALLEISGISWLDTNHLIAIEDLHASLYVLSMNKEVSVEKTIPFKDDKGKKIDIEDVALAGNNAYAIWSHGVIFEIDNWAGSPAVTQYETGLTKEDNTEGICLDTATGNLLVACKGRGEAEEGEKKSSRAVYVFNTKDKKLDAAPRFVISKKTFKEKIKDEVDFNPAAISIDPVSKNIYMLSTLGTKCLASFDAAGTLLTFQYLDPAIFPQPEGLCFSPDGTLYISSEGKNTPGVICKFNRPK